MRRSLVLVLATGCAAARPPVPPPRFANAPPVTVVDDRRHVAVAPERHRYLPHLHHYDGHFHRRISRALGLPRARRALGVNSIDEVPDSTWFTNRIGVRMLSPDDVRRGPLRIATPEHFKPWSIVSTKSGGKSAGFVIRDARGERFLLKFEARGYPELETAAHVIANRLLWAAGYNVPEDHVVYFHPLDLVLRPDSVVEDPLDGERPMSRRDVDRILGPHDRGHDGSIRALASRFVPGKVLGGHPGRGVRADDPNDRIPHELRRDLRGATAYYAWLDHGDLNAENFLDAWSPDRADPRRHYVVHYLIDFGKSLGVMAAATHRLRHGFSYVVDFGAIARNLISLGFADEPWRGRDVPGLRGVGLYEARLYDPGRWKPDWASYGPWQTADRFDKFWAAKTMARFSKAHLRAAVDAGRLSDPAAAEYLTQVLLARARKTARYWFERVNPLDRFAVRSAGAGLALCFEDLALVHRLATAPETTQYTIASHDRAGRALGAPATIAAQPTGRTCTQTITLASDDYTIVRITTARPRVVGSTYVHLARAPGTGEPRVIGLWRE